MAEGRTTLEDLRRHIDAIDDQLHDLLMRRVSIVEAIGREKKDAKLPALRPGREAMILRRLAERHSGRFPRAALVRMWREMLAATVGMQTKFVVAVYVPSESSGYWDLARDHFGSHAPMLPFNSPSQVIQAVSGGPATVGILPMPQEGERNPWWRSILGPDDSAPRVLARLPFAGRGNARADGGDALVVGQGALEPTGADRSLLVVEAGGEVSRTRLLAGFAAAGLACTFFAQLEAAPERTLNLVELADFVLPGDPRLAIFHEHVGPTVDRIVSLGSYAAPLTLGEAAAGATAAAQRGPRG